MPPPTNIDRYTHTEVDDDDCETLSAFAGSPAPVSSLHGTAFACALEHGAVCADLCAAYYIDTQVRH